MLGVPERENSQEEITKNTIQQNFLLLKDLRSSLNVDFNRYKSNKAQHYQVSKHCCPVFWNCLEILKASKEKEHSQSGVKMNWSYWEKHQELEDKWNSSFRALKEKYFQLRIWNYHTAILKGILDDRLHLNVKRKTPRVRR